MDFRIILHNYPGNRKEIGCVCGTERGLRMYHPHRRSCSTTLRSSLVKNLCFFIGALSLTGSGIRKMKILVSNDDGYRSEGIVRLRAALAEVAEVTVVAPDRNRSGASNSLTLDVPLRVTQSEPGVHFVTGTPTDCVHLAVSGLFDFDFDMAVSGVNDGPNLGDDVLYSGTVAAAIEGRFLGLPTLAVSLCTQTGGGRHFESGAIVAQRIVTQLVGRPLDPRLILNINVPDLPLAQLRGIRATRLGFRHRSEPAIPVRNPKGEYMYWVGPSGAGADAGAGTDFHAVAEGWVSVTPLSIDLTRHSAVPELGQWLSAVQSGGA